MEQDNSMPRPTEPQWPTSPPTGAPQWGAPPSPPGGFTPPPGTPAYPPPPQAPGYPPPAYPPPAPPQAGFPPPGSPPPGYAQGYPPAGYPPAGYGHPYAPPAPSNGLAVAALVCSIIGLCTFWMLGLGAIPGLLGVILGAVGMNRAKQLPNNTGSGQAKVGIVLGIVAIVASVAFFSYFLSEVDDSNITFNTGRVNSDPADGSCNHDRFLQDPDC
jgi:hypothetical protein